MDTMEKIDFVVAWVDGADPVWCRERAHYLNPDIPVEQIDIRETRYRDWDNLHYWFRAVEKYAPWVNKIHFVTWGHLPPWLNTSASKLHIVRHSDFIPANYLPTFSSHPIELNLHRIPGLSEQFVYFNDDFFLTAPVQPTDFFVNGLPCDYLEETPMAFSWRTPMNSVRVNDIVFCSEHFDRRRNRKEQWRKWYAPADIRSMLKNVMMGTLNDKSFFGLNIHHLPQAYQKHSLEAVWNEAYELLNETCTHKFRDERDVSQCVFKFWQLLSGNFQPYNKRKYGRVFRSQTQLDAICQQITGQERKTMCIIDAEQIDFAQAKQKVNAAFEAVLPDKSSFEK